MGPFEKALRTVEEENFWHFRTAKLPVDKVINMLDLVENTLMNGAFDRDEISQYTEKITDLRAFITGHLLTDEIVTEIEILFGDIMTR